MYSVDVFVVKEIVDWSKIWNVWTLWRKTLEDWKQLLEDLGCVWIVVWKRPYKPDVWWYQKPWFVDFIHGMLFRNG